LSDLTGPVTRGAGRGPRAGNLVGESGRTQWLRSGERPLDEYPTTPTASPASLTTRVSLTVIKVGHRDCPYPSCRSSHSVFLPSIPEYPRQGVLMVSHTSCFAVMMSYPNFIPLMALCSGVCRPVGPNASATCLSVGFCAVSQLLAYPTSRVNAGEIWPG